MDITVIIQVFFIAASLVVGTYSYLKNKTHEKLLIIIYSLFSFITSSLALFENIRFVIVNPFTIFEYFIFSFIITKAVGLGQIKVALIGLSLTFLCFSFPFSFKSTWFHSINFGSIVIENLCITILSLLYYNSILKHPNEIPLTKEFSFWMITGGIFYFCLTTPYFILAGMLNFDNRYMFYLINVLANITMHCLFIKAFLCTVRK